MNKEAEEVSTETLNELKESIYQLSEYAARELMKAIRIIKVVSHEQAQELVQLCQSGMTFKQIAEMWGVEV